MTYSGGIRFIEHIASGQTAQNIAMRRTVFWRISSYGRPLPFDRNATFLNWSDCALRRIAPSNRSSHFFCPCRSRHVSQKSHRSNVASSSGPGNRCKISSGKILPPNTHIKSGEKNTSRNRLQQGNSVKATVIVPTSLHTGSTCSQVVSNGASYVAQRTVTT